MNLQPCITRLPENGYGGNVTKWPERLHTPPDRLQSIQIDAYISRKELFKAESKYWNEIIGSYVRAWHWKTLKFRNVLDMRAGYGGYYHSLCSFFLSLTPGTLLSFCCIRSQFFLDNANLYDSFCDFGRFAAALVDFGIDCWVMNVVPVSGPNTLPVINDRGLIGVMHDWFVLSSLSRFLSS